jgi:hypothetical protein
VLDGIHPEEKPIQPPLVLQAGRNTTLFVRSGEWKLILGDGTPGAGPQPVSPTGAIFMEEADQFWGKHRRSGFRP